MKKTYVFLIVNIMLWFFTLKSLSKILLAPNNAFDNTINSWLTQLNNWCYGQYRHLTTFAFDWQTLVFVLLMVVLVVLIFRFWQTTFIVMSALTAIAVILTIFYIVKGQRLITDYYPMVVLVISLGNIWLSAKASNLK